MKQFNDIKIKDSWKDISLEDFYLIQGLLTSDDKDEFDEFEKKIKIICILSGVPETYFDDYTLNQVKELFSSLKFLMEEPKGDIQDYYIINGKEYKLCTTIKGLTAGQFIDLNNFIKDKDQIIDNLPGICSVLLIPTVKLSRKKRLFNKLFSIAASHPRSKQYLEKRGIKAFTPEAEKYLQTDIEETTDNIFKFLSIEQGMGISTFFFAISNLYIECLADSLTLTKNQEFLSVLQSLKSLQETKDTKEMKIITDNLKNLQELETFTGIGNG